MNRLWLSGLLLLTAGCIDQARTLEEYCEKQPALCGPLNTRPPRIDGELVAGRVLSAEGDEWTSDLPFTRGYLWQRCCGATSCEGISGATAQQYALVSADVECRIAVTVTATNEKGFSAVAVSPQTGLVDGDLAVGSVVAFASSTLPSGWLWADGTGDLQQAEYPELFSVLGQTYGGGAGTFAVPDLRGTFLLGAGAADPIGEKRGALDHSHSASALPHSHSVALPGHGHDAGSIFHNHRVVPDAVNITQHASGGTLVMFLPATGYWTTSSFAAQITVAPVPATSLATVSVSHTATSLGAGVLPPYAVIGFAIRARSDADAACGAVFISAGSDPVPGDGGLHLAEGGAVDRAQQARLFGCTGTAFGAGDGASTFNLPDLRARFALGRTATGAQSSIGVTGGADQHSHTVSEAGGSHTLDVPIHSHEATRQDHQHNITGGQFGAACDPSGGLSGANFNGMTTATNPADVKVTDTGSRAGQVTSSVAPSATASSSTATALPPYIDLRAVLFDDPGARVPPGTIVPYLSAIPPGGWLRANGTAVEKAKYPALFAAIGTRFGSPDAQSFNLPDLSGRIPRGASSTPDSVGLTGGAALHAHSYAMAAHSHSVTLPFHAHSWSFGGHTHFANTSSSGCNRQAAGTRSAFFTIHPALDGGAGTHVVDAGVQTVTTGAAASSGTLVDTGVAPSFTVSYIIKY